MRSSLFAAVLAALLSFSVVVLAAPSADAAEPAYGAWSRANVTFSDNGTRYQACARSGILPYGSNQGNVRAYSNGTLGCPNNSYRTVPTGYLAVRVQGYRDGTYCGATTTHYSSQPAWNWNVTSQLCSNPSGQQEFRTVSTGSAYRDGSILNLTNPTVGYIGRSTESPRQNY